MVGGLMQLSAYGVQDVYLTGNPQMTFFKSVYHRHTNYSMEAVEYTFDKTNPEFGDTLRVTIPKSGDLLYRAYLQVSLADLGSGQWQPYVAHEMIKNISIYIGNVLVDKHAGLVLHNVGELIIPQSKWRAYQSMIGYPQDDSTYGMILYIPLQFWFCRRLGSAIPLCALQHQDIRIELELNTQAYVMTPSANNKINYIKLYIDNIYLDFEERNKFINNEHEYLIDQVQTVSYSMANVSKKDFMLPFNNAVKEILWTQRQVSKKRTDYTEEYTLDEVSLKLNGIDRFPPRSGKYFSFVQPYQHHTRAPAGEISESSPSTHLPSREEPDSTSNINKQIHVYSFAEKPEELQPSGTCNMSNLDSAVLRLTYSGNLTNSEINILALSYNILRIKSGFCDLAFTY